MHKIFITLNRWLNNIFQLIIKYKELTLITVIILILDIIMKIYYSTIFEAFQDPFICYLKMIYIFLITIIIFLIISLIINLGWNKTKQIVKDNYYDISLISYYEILNLIVVYNEVDIPLPIFSLYIFLMFIFTIIIKSKREEIFKFSKIIFIVCDTLRYTLITFFIAGIIFNISILITLYFGISEAVPVLAFFLFNALYYFILLGIILGFVNSVMDVIRRCKYNL